VICRGIDVAIERPMPAHVETRGLVAKIAF